MDLERLPDSVKGSLTAVPWTYGPNWREWQKTQGLEFDNSLTDRAVSRDEDIVQAVDPRASRE
jgi:hypothetical protein